MNLTLFSYNGIAINDGTTYTSLFLPGSRFDLHAQAVFSDRSENYPYLSGAVLPPHTLTINIINPSNTNISTTREAIKGIFNPTNFTPYQLIAKDSADSDRQWYVVGYPVSLVNDPKVTTDTSFLVTLALADPIWRTVNLNSTNWTITATGQTQAVTPRGNVIALPKFAITPTSARTGQFAYSRWCRIYNQATNPLIDYPIDVTNGGISTSALINDTTVSNQINQVGGIDAVVTTIPIDTSVGGGLPAVGFGYVGTEQISWTGNSGTSLTGVTRGIGGTTAATHADNAVIARSKMLANGADIRVQVDGTFANYWLDGINTATTKIWTVADWQAKLQGTLRTALPNNSTTTSVSFAVNSANLKLLKTLKGAANNVFIIGSEAFTYSPSNINLVTYAIAGCLRAQKNTSAAAHSVGDTIIPIEHDIWLIYGNSAATAYDTDDTVKPLLNLNSATNTSWTFSNFYDTRAARPASWIGQVLQSVGKQSLVYTGNQQAFANPSTELGLRMLDYQLSNIWKSETTQLAWTFYHPCGITTVSMAGSKYAWSLNSTWPAIVGLQKSSNGLQWLTVWTEAIPASAQTWTAFTHNTQSLTTTYNWIRFAIQGTITALANNEADAQADTITLALDSTLTPSVTLGSETGIYYLAAQITNNLTGEYITVNFNMAINATLTVDCALKTVTLSDGTNAIGALTTSTVRNEWLSLTNGVANTLQFDDSGSTGLTIVVSFNDRSL